MKIIYLFTLILFIPYSFKGQYVNYSQFYSSPLNLNPALTGVGEYGRIGFIYRNQWPSINQGYHYISSWADYNLSQNNFSIGLNFSNETENVSNLSTTHISPSLAYEINLSYKWILKSGMQISYTNSNFNNQNLINRVAAGEGFPNDLRPMALRGPLVIQGWGYDLNGKPIPNKADNEANALALAIALG